MLTARTRKLRTEADKIKDKRKKRFKMKILADLVSEDVVNSENCYLSDFILVVFFLHVCVLV